MKKEEDLVNRQRVLVCLYEVCTVGRMVVLFTACQMFTSSAWVLCGAHNLGTVVSRVVGQPSSSDSF